MSHDATPEQLKKMQEELLEKYPWLADKADKPCVACQMEFKCPKHESLKRNPR